ncbi:MAG: ABC transporter permease [Planctomycetes bacterium]|nr:ABC transporter permease [Planctomycetota bacterium]
MFRVLAIAKATFVESVRDRVLYGILLFAVGIILCSAFLDAVNVGDRFKFLRDFTAASISFFGLAICIFLGVGLVSKEIERRSLYWLLVKPLSRSQFLLGKYLGLVALLFLDFLIMGAGFLLVSHALERTWVPAYGALTLLLFLKYAVVTSVSIVFSTFSGQTLSVILTLLVYLVAHSTAHLTRLAEGQGWFTETVAGIAYRVFPNLERLSFHARLLHDIRIPAAELAWSVAYGLAYIAAALGVAMLVFKEREFN